VILTVAVCRRAGVPDVGAARHAPSLNRADQYADTVCLSRAEARAFNAPAKMLRRIGRMGRAGRDPALCTSFTNLQSTPGDKLAGRE
jgi:hypothetical protein